MAFESPTPNRSSFDAAAFFGVIIGILVIAGVLFLFRNPIAAKIAAWRQSGQPVVATNLPPALDFPVATAPAPTPTPTATVAPGAAVKTSTPKPRATSKATTPTGTLPQSGPETLPLIGFAVAGLGVASAARTRYYQRKLRRSLPRA
jgi:hypothetical protein